MFLKRCLLLTREAGCNALTWFARVPTEPNISDFPSRSADHPLLEPKLNCSDSAVEILDEVRSHIANGAVEVLGEVRSTAPI